MRIYHVVSSRRVLGLAPASLPPGDWEINDVLKSKHMDRAPFCATLQRMPPRPESLSAFAFLWLLWVSELQSKALMEGFFGIESPFNTKDATPDIIQPLKWLIHS